MDEIPFEVSFTKDGSYGVNVNDLSPGNIVVNTINADGCVPKWNAKYPNLSIAAGDIIMKLNGAEATQMSLADVEVGSSVVLQILRKQSVVKPEAVIMGAPGEPESYEFEEFEVRFRKEGRYGMNVDEKSPGNVVINTVYADGCVPKWNAAFPKLSIRAGDIIAKVNGAEATEASLKEVEAGNVVVLQILRKQSLVKPGAVDTQAPAAPETNTLAASFQLPPANALQEDEFNAPTEIRLPTMLLTTKIAIMQGASKRPLYA